MITHTGKRKYEKWPLYDL